MRFDDSDERFEALSDDIRSRIRVSIPVRVEADSDGHTVRLQPLIKGQQRQPDGTVKLVDLPIIDKGPINHHGGGGTTVTHAHRKGDEGLWVIADRSIDVWFDKGGIQFQADTRMHALSDGTYLPGVRNDPRKLDPAPNRRASETRSDDGKVRRTTDPERGHSDTVKSGAHGVTLDGQTGELKATAKTLALRSGETTPGGQPDTGTAKDLNDVVRGALARLAQVENQTNALFHATSRLRELTQTQVPAVAALAGILNKEVSGIEAMLGDLDPAKAQAFLQKTVEKALEKFMTPNLGGLTSLLGGGVEGLIAASRAQVEQLVSQNPVVAQIDDLRRQSDQLAVGGVPNAALLARIATLSAQNPVAAQVQDLRTQIANLVGQAGDGLNFLGPQKRAVQGILRSVTLSEG